MDLLQLGADHRRAYFTRDIYQAGQWLAPWRAGLPERNAAIIATADAVPCPSPSRAEPLPPTSLAIVFGDAG
jgi:hypothetical protein